MTAEVILTHQVRQDILDLNNVVISARVWQLIERLKNWPAVSGVKRLSGNLAGKCRMRTGDYRIQFHVVTETVAVGDRDKTKRKKASQTALQHKIVIEKIGHRDGFYES